jgi:transcriptional regulator with PAS, ATPase and Fis domain
MDDLKKIAEQEAAEVYGAYEKAKDLRKLAILGALAAHKGGLKESAAQLGISRAYLSRLIHRDYPDLAEFIRPKGFQKGTGRNSP